MHHSALPLAYIKAACHCVVAAFTSRCCHDLHAQTKRRCPIVRPGCRVDELETTTQTNLQTHRTPRVKTEQCETAIRATVTRTRDCLHAANQARAWHIVMCGQVGEGSSGHKAHGHVRVAGSPFALVVVCARQDGGGDRVVRGHATALDPRRAAHTTSACCTKGRWARARSVG